MFVVGLLIQVAAGVVGVLFFGLLVVLLLQAAGVLKRIPFSYNVRNLFVRWRITLLTGLAFTLVVGLMTVMLAFVNGLFQLTKDSGIPGNVIVLADGATDEVFSNLGYGDIDKIQFEPLVMKDEAGKAVWSRETYLIVNQPILRKRCPECARMVPVDRFGEKLVAHDHEEGEAEARPRPWFAPLGVRMALGLAAAGVVASGLVSALGRRRGLAPGVALGLVPFAAMLTLPMWLPATLYGSLTSVPPPKPQAAVGTQCEGSGLRVPGRGRRFLQVRGLADAVMAGRVHNIAIYDEGTWFSSAGVGPVPGSASGELAIQCVIGEGIARELARDLGKEKLVVNDVFELGPRKWIVTGVMKSSGSMFDSEVWANVNQISEQFGKKTYTTIVLRTADAESAKSLSADLVKNFTTPAVAATPESEYYEKLNTTNQQFLGAILVVLAIMAVGSVFGVMNTMFAAIAQRTKDIGVMRILGYAPWQLLVSFFLEAVLLALIGGAVGCALGSLANGVSATSIAGSGQGGGKTVVLKLVVDAKIVSAGMLFALVMGCAGGLIPALSAMRLKPLDAVR